LLPLGTFLVSACLNQYTSYTMNKDRFWELISLKLSGEAKPEELTELETLLQETPDEGFSLEVLETIWVTPHQGQAIQTKETFNRHMQRLSNHLSDPVLQYETNKTGLESADIENVSPVRKHSKLFWVTGIAASIILFVFLFIGLPEAKKADKHGAQNTISTKRGSKSKVQLPDGTEVWLNSDSRITYNENFQENIREVSLEGEAFFDVKRDEARPFVIHTTSIDVKVLGTAFNVRSYANEKNTETSLIRGSVEITLVKSPDKKKIILRPNDKLIVNNNECTLLQDEKRDTHEPVMTLAKINYKQKDSSAVEIYWVKNKLAFDEETLENIALKIERWYDVKVMIGDEKLKQEYYTAFFEDKTLHEVMEALRLSAGGEFKYSIEGKQVTIKR
jgi:transmembrane sensor